jgi:hypothetical protein
MVKSWKDMTVKQKLESNRKMIEGLSARLDEVGGVSSNSKRRSKNCKVKYPARQSNLAPSSIWVANN